MKKIYWVLAVVLIVVVAAVASYFVFKKSPEYRKYYDECTASMVGTGLDDGTTKKICTCMAKKLAKEGTVTLDSSTKIIEECLSPLFPEIAQ